jgi:FkbM family methyltransferase
MTPWAYLGKIHKLVSYWAPVIGSYPRAFFFLTQAKFGQSTVRANYCGINFRFRNSDMSAIDETLIRGEYNFISPEISRQESPLIVDVGMNVGDFSILAIAVNPRSRIVGIEADASTVVLSRSNAPKGYPSDSWVVHHRAAWRSNEEILLETGKLSVSSKISPTGNMLVQGIDLPTLWSLLPSDTVDIMKIDIEGAEEAFLSTWPEFLNRIRHLIVEIHPRACDEQKLRQLLAKYFLQVKDVKGRISSKPLLYCHRN